MLRSFAGTRLCCYLGLVIQAVINNLSPVLFIVYQEEFGISYLMISLLVLINFSTQLLVDLLSVHITRRIGYRSAVVLSQGLAAAGLVLLAVLPRLLPVPFLGLVIPTMIYAFGSGLIEVLVSPMIENLPLPNKASQMSLLHSFYCWGQLLTVLVTTVLLYVFGHAGWVFIPLLWAVLPLCNLFCFLKVPIVEGEEENHAPVRRLLGSRLFRTALTIMLCAGAAELAMSQWSSLFAEQSLGVSKVTGDLLGPCMFALFMGAGRLAYGFFGKFLNIYKCLILCAVLCTVAYLITGLSTSPLLGLAGCSLCGLSVSLMWPGAVSLSAGRIRGGGTSMFALLAVFGDLGCSFGPFLTGTVSDAVAAAEGFPLSPLNAGLLTGALFGVLMLILLLRLRKKEDETPLIAEEV
ncbi:MAG: MFS transporter [Candidatus Howiella sp.]|jgi:fucose permease